MILFDAHVHIYDCFDLNLMIDSAFGNFQQAIKKLELAERQCHCFLLLAESFELDYFSSTKDTAETSVTSIDQSWKIERTEENHSLNIVHSDYPDISMTLVAGRQIVSREGLEILALFTNERFPDNSSLHQTVDEVIDRGGIAVCPWGAGKWLGKRGEILEEYASGPTETAFFLGDNGGRPSIWPPSKLLQSPGFTGRTLSGTDPLPLPGQESRVGSFGGYCNGDYSPKKPATTLKNHLLAPGVEILPFGKPSSPITFVKNQLALRRN